MQISLSLEDFNSFIFLISNTDISQHYLLISSVLYLIPRCFDWIKVNSLCILLDILSFIFLYLWIDAKATLFPYIFDDIYFSTPSWVLFHSLLLFVWNNSFFLNNVIERLSVNYLTNFTTLSFSLVILSGSHSSFLFPPLFSYSYSPFLSLYFTSLIKLVITLIISDDLEFFSLSRKSW